MKFNMTKSAETPLPVDLPSVDWKDLAVKSLLGAGVGAGAFGLGSYMANRGNEDEEERKHNMQRSLLSGTMLGALSGGGLSAGRQMWNSASTDSPADKIRHALPANIVPFWSATESLSGHLNAGPLGVAAAGLPRSILQQREPAITQAFKTVLGDKGDPDKANLLGRFLKGNALFAQPTLGQIIARNPDFAIKTLATDMPALAKAKLVRVANHTGGWSLIPNSLHTTMTQTLASLGYNPEQVARMPIERMQRILARHAPHANVTPEKIDAIQGTGRGMWASGWDRLINKISPHVPQKAQGLLAKVHTSPTVGARLLSGDQVTSANSPSLLREVASLGGRAPGLGNAAVSMKRPLAKGGRQALTTYALMKLLNIVSNTGIRANLTPTQLEKAQKALSAIR